MRWTVNKIGIVCFLVVSKINLVQESSLHKERDRAIDCCPGRTGLRLPNTLPQLVCGKMIICRKDSLDNRVPLRRVAEPFRLNELLQARLDRGFHEWKPRQKHGIWRIGNFDIGFFLELGFYRFVRHHLNNFPTRQWLVLALIPLLLVSCANNEPEPLSVRQFHLRDITPADKDAQMVRGEQLYRMRGAVTLEQRRNRLGDYYTIYWNTAEAASGNLKVVFEYQQATTASKILTMTRDIPASQTSGSVEFRIAGEAYREGGNVLAWRARLMKGGRVIAMKRSYLWR